MRECLLLCVHLESEGEAVKSLLDPKDTTGEYPFQWVDSQNTDIKKTFARLKNAAPQAEEKHAHQGADESAVAAPNIQSLSLWRKA